MPTYQAGHFKDFSLLGLKEKAPCFLYSSEFVEMKSALEFSERISFDLGCFMFPQETLQSSVRGLKVKQT